LKRRIGDIPAGSINLEIGVREGLLMNEFQSQWRHDRMLDERIRAGLPAMFAILMALGIASALLAWGEGYTTGFVIGAVVLASTLIRPELALIVVTIMAPLQIYVDQMGSIVPGTGITPVNLVVLILILGAWAQRFSVHKPSVEASGIDKPLLLFIAWSGFSVIVGIIMWRQLDTMAIGEWLAMSCGFLMYWVVRRRWRSIPLATAAVWACLVMVLFESVLVVREFRQNNTAVYDEKLKYIITGTFPSGNSNDIACYLSVYAMVALGLFLAMRFSVWRWPALLIYLAASAGTFVTYSRASYIALIVGSGIVILFKHKRYLIPAIVVVVLLPSVLPASVMERANTRGDDSAEARKDYWKNGIGLMLTHPVGVGWRGYSKNEMARGQHIRDPHSMYVLVAAEQGIVGISLFLVLLVSTGREIVKAIKRAKTPLAQGLGVGMFGALVAFAINCVFGSRMVWFYSVEHFWLLLGILMVITRVPETEVAVEEEPEVKVRKPESPWRYRSYV
jgi:O-antigen ligase